MTPATPQRHRLGSTLVLLQFGLLLALGLMALPALARPDIGIGAAVWLAASAALGGWTLRHNRLGNFNIHPQPKAGGRLIVSGPYRLVRHPMYSAVLLLAAGLADLSSTWTAWSAWLALLAVLWLKADLEERWLVECHPDYAAYRARTRRFVPWVL